MTPVAVELDKGGGTRNEGDFQEAFIAALFEKVANKGAASGYLGLGTTGLAETSQLGTGTANSSSYLAGDGTWKSVDNFTGTIAPERGVFHEWLSTTTYRFVPSSQLDDAVVHVPSGSSLAAITVESPITCDMTHWGANGRDYEGSGDGAAPDNGMHYSYLIEGRGGAALIASKNSSAPTLPIGYSLKSRWLWPIPVASGQIRQFEQFGAWFVYSGSLGIYPSGMSDQGTGGLATTTTPIDGTGIVPAGATEVAGWYDVMNNSGAKTIVVTDSMGVRVKHFPSSAAANSAYREGLIRLFYGGTPSSLCTYAWSGIPGAAGSHQGLNLCVLAILVKSIVGAAA